MYELDFVGNFSSTYKAIIRENSEYEKRVNKALRLLKNDPFYPSLKSHKVTTKSFGKRWSSWITGDLRIIWDFDLEEKERIIVFAITVHSGTHKEYK